MVLLPFRRTRINSKTKENLRLKRNLSKITRLLAQNNEKLIAWKV